MNSFGQFFKDSFIPHAPEERIQEDQELAQIYTHRSSITAGIVQSKSIPFKVTEAENNEDISDIDSTEKFSHADTSERRLQNKHIQLIGVGGTIGTALFVTMGSDLVKAGGAGLLIAFTMWCGVVLMITISTAEMVCYLPISSPFIRLAGRCCDEALEFTSGWNFWFLESSLIPFEIVAVNTIVHYWRDDYSPGIPIALQVLAYFLINIFGVGLYGETEFWLAIGKVVLAVVLMLFTLVVMCGGNPQHDKFGFRNWAILPFNEYIHTGSLGRFEGWLGALIHACFMIAGPEYVSMAAGEVVNPRKTLPSAFKQVFYRLTFFFLGGCLCMATLVAPNDPLLIESTVSSLPGAGASPYVIAMTNLHIRVLPHVVNVLLVTSAFSAGNSYTYCSSRALFGMALDGKAPKILAYTTNTGVPIYCVLVALCWAMLAFLQMSESTAVVLDWITSLVTSSQLINYCIICCTYYCFFKGMEARGMDRNELPFKGWWQPYLAFIGGGMAFTMTFVSTYTLFIPGGWDVKSFLFSYIMIFIDLVLFFGWKLIKRTKWRAPEEVDLFSNIREIEEYEISYYAKKEAENNGEPEKVAWYKSITKFLYGGA